MPGKVSTGCFHRRRRRIASMRPRHCAGESRALGLLPPDCQSRFNEAPALCRGKSGLRGRRGVRQDASMRPRHCAGESGRTRGLRRRVQRRFNEAPALCRGKSCRTAGRGSRDRCFNEAPALCRGKWESGRRGRIWARTASMRPDTTALY